MVYYRLYTQHRCQQCDETIGKLFWRHVSAVNSHLQINVKHILGMESHRLHTFIVPRICFTQAEDGCLQPKHVAKIVY